MNNMSWWWDSRYDLSSPGRLRGWASDIMTERMQKAKDHR